MGEQGHRLFVLGYPDAALADAAIAELDELATTSSSATSTGRS